MALSTSRTFDSFEAFNSFPHGWDTEFRVTSGEDFRASIKHVASEGILVNSAGFTQATLQRGSTPPGMRTLALPRRVDGPTSWLNHDIDDQSLMLFPESRELLCVSSARMHVDTLSVADAMFERQLAEIDVTDERPLRDGQVVRVSPGKRLHLQQCLESLDACCKLRPAVATGDKLERFLAEELVYQFASLALGTGEEAHRLPFHAAARTTRRAMRFILPRLRTPLTVAEVCADSGIGRRSLELSFRRYLGMPPKQFIKQTRLALCREALLNAPTGKVGDIALGWGFWHMGQFGRDYKALFGELPSQTIQRARN